MKRERYFKDIYTVFRSWWACAFTMLDLEDYENKIANLSSLV